MNQKRFSINDWRESPLLSEETKREKRLAQCPLCFRLYRDDCPASGSIMSPCCDGVALERGLLVS